MNKKDIEKKVKSIIAKELDCRASSLTNESGLLTHFNWDSLSHIAIITELEAAFKVVVPDGEIANLVTVKKLLEFVEGCISV